MEAIGGPIPFRPTPSQTISKVEGAILALFLLMRALQLFFAIAITFSFILVAASGFPPGGIQNISDVGVVALIAYNIPFVVFGVWSALTPRSSRRVVCNLGVLVGFTVLHIYSVAFVGHLLNPTQTIMATIASATVFLVTAKAISMFPDSKQGFFTLPNSNVETQARNR